MIQGYANEIAQVLATMESEEEEEYLEGGTYLTSQEIEDVQPAPLLSKSTRAQKRFPSWTVVGSRDGSDFVRTSRAHYYSLVGIQCPEREGALMLGLMDTGGARSMIDLPTARRLGLALRLRGDGEEFGKFWGPDAVLKDYAGIVPGPVCLRFSEEVTFTLAEVTVIEYGDPIFLVGTDVLGERLMSRPVWEFGYVGLDDDRQGVTIFRKNNRKVAVSLVSWPDTGATGTKMRARKSHLPGVSRGVRIVYDGEEPERTEAAGKVVRERRTKELGRNELLAALIKDRGQCL